MMAKVIKLHKYKRKKEQRALKHEIDVMDYDMKYVLEHGACDLCGTSGGNIRQTGNVWVCDCCSPSNLGMLK